MITHQSHRQTNNEEFVKTYMNNPNPLTKESAIKANLSLVKKIVGRMNIPEQGILQREDLYQYGIIGLIDALDRYDEKFGVKFGTYAYHRIYGEIMDAIRKLGVLNREQIRFVKKIHDSIADLRSRFAREPTVREVCDYADITPQDYYAVEQLNNLNFTLSIDEKVYENSDGTIIRRDVIPDDNQETPERVFERKEIKNQLKSIIKRLPEKQRVILALYYYEELTLADIGKVLGVSESRVSQILKQTLIDIRQEISPT
jgi:RNA polymerase sigma factor for flagellar operon FliA